MQMVNEFRKVQFVAKKKPHHDINKLAKPE